jgi:hypothetical protein
MQENIVGSNALVDLYVVKVADGSYFGGFDSSKGKASFVINPREAKKFTNKFDIKLRPNEMIVQLTIDLNLVECLVSEPFRPQRRVK